MTEYLYFLSIGHVLGDFYFQTDRMARAKEKRFAGVVYHSLEYLVVMLAVSVPIMSPGAVLAAAALAVLHFLIDAGKFKLVRMFRIRRRDMVFIWDQVCHVLTIFAVSYMMYCLQVKVEVIKPLGDAFAAFGTDPQMLAKWVLSLLVLHVPSNIFIQILLADGRPKETRRDRGVMDDGVGKRIGTIERLIMLMFISMDQYSAMGLVLTAKSIARFEKISKEQAFAEYYLMGTLLSTALVVACKLIIL
ncbi:MAG: DUF3307 domain-containing protein [Lachnospiraceae bacterium]|nr:DUF3307 domain-containing protein [Lachnospiraceae bacterium]